MLAYAVYRLTNVANTNATSCNGWTATNDGRARYIDVHPNGSPWIVMSTGTIRHRNGVTALGTVNQTGTSWSTYGGKARDIALGPDDSGIYGSMWITGHASEGTAIYQFNFQNQGSVGSPVAPAQNRWYRSGNGGDALFITVGRNSLPWLVGTDNSAWRRRPR